MVTVENNRGAKGVQQGRKVGVLVRKMPHFSCSLSGVNSVQGKAQVGQSGDPLVSLWDPQALQDMPYFPTSQEAAR